MFRKHYESANESLSPSKELISDTKQKMYEQLLDLEFSDDDKILLSPVENKSFVKSELNDSKLKKMTRFATVACSVAACSALICVSTVVFMHHKSADTAKDNTHIVATCSPDISETMSLDFWYGNYSGACNSSLLTISKKDDTSFQYVLKIKDNDNKTYADGTVLTGTAVMDGTNRASHKDNFDTNIEFVYKHGTITVKSVISDKVKFEGEFINIDGKRDLSSTNYFSKTRTFGANTTYQLDINNDGKADLIRYKDGILHINGYHKDFAKSCSESLDRSRFYMVDIDTTDSFVDILVMDEGPSSDPVTYIIRYENDKNVKVTNLECDIKDITFDNNCGINGRMRLSVLQTWYGYCSWDYNQGTPLFIEQDYYTPLEPSLYSPHPPVKLKSAVKMYTSPDKNSQTFEMQPQEVSFKKTDNRHWIQVAGKNDHPVAWLYVTDFNYIPSMNRTADEVFDNLLMVD